MMTVIHFRTPKNDQPASRFYNHSCQTPKHLGLQFYIDCLYHIKYLVRESVDEESTCIDSLYLVTHNFEEKKVESQMSEWFLKTAKTKNHSDLRVCLYKRLNADPCLVLISYMVMSKNWNSYNFKQFHVNQLIVMLFLKPTAKTSPIMF